MSSIMNIVRMYAFKWLFAGFQFGPLYCPPCYDEDHRPHRCMLPGLCDCTYESSHP